METVISWANSGLAILVVLGLCLFFHEAGHFLAAKACRMKVYEFAMGFGPALWKRAWRGTDYALRIIPFGGFVRIAGMEPGEGSDVADGFHSKPRWQGAIVVCAGVFMNIVLAVLVYWAVFVFSGVEVPGSNEVVIRKVFAHGAAAAAGIEPGDRVVAVGESRRSTTIKSVNAGSIGQRIGLKPEARVFQVGTRRVSDLEDALSLMKASATTGDKIWILDGKAASIETAFVSLDPLSEADAARIPDRIERRDLDTTAQRVLGVTFKPLDQTGVYEYIAGNPGKPLSLTVLRGTETVRLSLVPRSEMARVEKVSEQGKLGQPHGTVGRMGVTLGPELQRTGVLEGLVLGAQQSVASVYTVVYSFKLMLNRTIEAEPTGTIGIMAMTAETAKLGWAAVLSFCGLISANLAVLNMFPIPPFDGFHVVLLGLEGLLGRRVNEKLEVYVRLAGFLLIINLFVLLTAKDVLNLIKYGTY